MAKSMGFDDLHQAFLQFLIAELDHPTALAADQMLVVRSAQTLLIARTVLEGQLSYKPCFHQEIECAVDGGWGNMVPRNFHPEICHIKVAGHPEDFLRDALTRPGDMKLSTPEVFLE